MNYIELSITFNQIDPWRDIMVSNLAEKGFESFVETKIGLQSYIVETDFSEDMINEYSSLEAIAEMTFKTILDENWNAEWEKNFDPVFVEDKLAIVAPFHKGEFTQGIVITIQPQMSFGTGHHQTTYLVMKAMFGIDFENTTVLDMGSGTGILAILAEKLNCKSALAIDIDEWAFQNTIDNIELNSCKKIEVLEGGAELLTEANKYELVLANINRNILVNDMKQYVSSMKKGGIIYMSGFYTSDVSIIQDEAAKQGLTFVDVAEREGWALAQFIKN